MEISVVGLWHLGTVTAACMAEKGFNVTGYDPDHAITDKLSKGIAPLFEPGLNELIQKNISEDKLRFSSDISSVASADLIWITYDTPVDDNDKADAAFVEAGIRSLFPYIKPGSAVLISSQLPAGSVKAMESAYREVYPGNEAVFACSPENLRLGKAIDVFMNPDRIVVGVRTAQGREKLRPFIEAITPRIVWMGVESAEMTKHAVNAFLATSVVFINELAVLCEHVGADAAEVERGLKTEMRIGEKAYLRPGAAFAGGTLARDLAYLVQKENESGLSTLFFSSIIQSNNDHKSWVREKITHLTGSIANRKIGVLGLTYKPGTDTLRRSSAIELCYWLHSQGAKVLAYDPAVKRLPDELNDVISLSESVQDVIAEAELVIIATEWPEFAALSSDDIGNVAGLRVIDESAFASRSFNKKGIHYISIGRQL